jgi:large subunit ribosomal protein L9
MKVILIEDVAQLGKVGDTVNVADGYARNYLFPNRKALDACAGNLRRFEHQKKILDGKVKKKIAEASDLGTRIESLRLTFTRKAGDGEKLFGSVTSMDIEKALADQGVELRRKDIQLAEPIKQLGIHTVPVKLFREVEANLKVWIVPEGEAAKSE